MTGYNRHNPLGLYMPSGAYRSSAIVGLPLLVIICSIPLIWAFVKINYSGYWISGGEIFCSLFVLGLLVGGAAFWLVRMFEVRNPGLAFKLVFSGALIAWLISYPMVYDYTITSLGFLDFFHDRLAGGIIVDDSLLRRGGGPDFKLVGGWGLAILWLYEFVVFSYCVAMLARLQARRPFSERTGRWYRKKTLRLIKPGSAMFENLRVMTSVDIFNYLAREDTFPTVRVGLFHESIKISLYLAPEEEWQYGDISFPKTSRFLFNHPITMDLARQLLAKYGKASLL